MAFNEYSDGGSFSGTTETTIVGGDANGTKLVKNLVVHNQDSASHTVQIEFKVGGSTLYRLFNVTLAPGDTLVQDFVIALRSATYNLVGHLGEAGANVKFVVTYAQVS
jgi:hypothetical protein